MDFPQTDPNAEPVQAQSLPPLPQLWIGFLFGIGAVVAEFIAVSLHPELAQGERAIPPLYLFLVIFLGLVYWLVCVHRYHVILQRVPGWKHPISPARAVGFHFIPIYYLYWVFKWPKEIATFVNARVRQPLMKPWLTGFMILAAFVAGPFFDPGLGLALLFFALSYVSACLRRALATPAQPAETIPPA